MNKVAIILFILGVIFEIGAFFGSQAKNIPAVLRFIAPRYSKAVKGLNILDSQNVLNPGNKGFREIADVFINVASQKNEPEIISSITVLRIVREGAELRFSPKRAREVIPIKFELSNGQTVNWDLSYITEEVNKLEQRSIFRYSIWILIAGLIFMSLAFFLKKK